MIVFIVQFRYIYSLFFKTAFYTSKIVDNIIGIIKSL